jgi:AsmA protein
MAITLPAIPQRARKPLIIAGAVFGGLLALLMLAILIVPNLIPQEVYRAEIEKVASQVTGRKVLVTGEIKVAVFPRIEARAGASSISNPEDFGEQPFAQMKELRAAVALWPLLFGGGVQIEEFVLVEPDIRLVKLADGTNNWTFDVGGGATGEPGAPQEPGGKLSAALRDVRIEKGRVSWEDRKEGTAQTLSDFELAADMEAMDRPLQFTAKGLANDLAFKLTARLDNPQATLDGSPSPATIKLETELINADLKGALGLGPNPQFDFEASGDIPSIVALADAFKLTDIPARNVLGRLTLSGQAFGMLDDITIKIGSAKHESPLLNATLKGEAQIANGVALQLVAEAEAPKLGELARAMEISAPAEEALGKATLGATISGRLDDLAFQNVVLAHDSGLLKLNFAGSATLKHDLAYNGHLSIAAPDLRKLAAAAGATLPAGDSVYKSFSLEGDTSGGSTDVLLSNASLTFDAITAKGEAALRFGGKPKLVGSLTTTSAINVTPYASASGAPTTSAPATTGWGKTPINLSQLNLVDADVTLKVGGIKYNAFDFGASTVAVALANGRMTADLKQTSLFGGKGSARLVADGSTAKPGIELRANIEGLGLKKLLTAAAGYGSLDGSGDLSVDIAGSGADLQTLMSSLVGTGGFAFENGLLSGVDLIALGDAAKAALGSQQIKGGVISPLAQTRFENLKTDFIMSEGVAMVAGLSIDADTFTLSGGGALDIGRQQATLSLFPQYKDKASGLNGYGLPMKLSGAWGKIDLAFDWDWLKDKAEAAFRNRANAEIQDELKDFTDGLADRFGFGKPKPAPATPTPAPATPAPAQSESPSAPPAEGEAAAQPQPAAPAPAPPAPLSAEDRLKLEVQKAKDRLLGRD